MSTTRKPEAQRAIDVLNDFISKDQKPGGALAWYLHIFCRRGKGDDWGYKGHVLEDTAYLMDMLIKTFLNPTAAAIFCEINEQEPDYLANHLPQLKTLFDDLANDYQASAQMDLIDVSRFGSELTDQQLHNLRVRYEREMDLREEKRQIIAHHAKRFDHNFSKIDNAA